MRVLAVCSVVPSPERRGDPVRFAGLLASLGRCSELTIWCANSDDGSPEGLRQRTNCPRISVFPTVERGGIGRISKVCHHIYSAAVGTPPWVLRRQSNELVGKISTLSDAEFDLVFVLGESAAQYMRHSSLSWHWDRCNILIESGRHQIREARSLSAGLTAAYTYLIDIGYEKRWMRQACTMSVTNDHEAGRLSRWYGRKAEAVLPSTVPIPESCSREPLPRTLLWLGNMSYRSNVNGLERYLDEGWPILERAGWQMLVVGSDMSDQRRLMLSRVPGVQPLGYVENLSRCLATVSVGIVPLWSGAGTKMKTLTMMAHGLPVVATKSGIEGLAGLAENGVDSFIVANTPISMSEAVLKLGADLDLNKAIGLAGRRLIQANFSEESLDHSMKNLLAAIGRHAQIVPTRRKPATSKRSSS